jgi:hypothetical protein
MQWHSIEHNPPPPLPNSTSVRWVAVAVGQYYWSSVGSKRFRLWHMTHSGQEPLRTHPVLCNVHVEANVRV